MTICLIFPYSLHNSANFEVDYPLKAASTDRALDSDAVTHKDCVEIMTKDPEFLLKIVHTSLSPY